MQKTTQDTQSGIDAKSAMNEGQSECMLILCDWGMQLLREMTRTKTHVSRICIILWSGFSITSVRQDLEVHCGLAPFAGEQGSRPRLGSGGTCAPGKVAREAQPAAEGVNSRAPAGGTLLPDRDR